jgi:hypothetical protein
VGTFRALVVIITEDWKLEKAVVAGKKKSWWAKRNPESRGG